MTRKEKTRDDYKLVTTYAYLADRMYFFGKQKRRYLRERDFIDKVMCKFAPGKKIIDAGCGTGIHIKLLRELGYKMSGFDLRREMVAVAKKRNPSVKIVQRDMRNFPLKWRADGIICMYGAVNYLETEKGLEKTFSHFFKHLNHGGIVIIDTREWANLDEKIYRWHTDEYTLVKRWIKSAKPMESVYRVFFTIPSEGVMEMEDHKQYFQGPLWLKNKMLEAGFFKVDIYDNYNLNKSFIKKSGGYLPVLVGEKD